MALIKSFNLSHLFGYKVKVLDPMNGFLTVFCGVSLGCLNWFGPHGWALGLPFLPGRLFCFSLVIYHRLLHKISPEESILVAKAIKPLNHVIWRPTVSSHVGTWAWSLTCSQLLLAVVKVKLRALTSIHLRSFQTSWSNYCVSWSWVSQGFAVLVWKPSR